jgi:hypothetical protein
MQTHSLGNYPTGPLYGNSGSTIRVETSRNTRVILVVVVGMIRFVGRQANFTRNRSMHLRHKGVLAVFASNSALADRGGRYGKSAGTRTHSG